MHAAGKVCSTPIYVANQEASRADYKRNIPANLCHATCKRPVPAYLDDVQENGVQDNLWQEIRETCSCCYTPVHDPVVQWPEHDDHSNPLSIHYPS